MHTSAAAAELALVLLACRARAPAALAVSVTAVTKSVSAVLPAVNINTTAAAGAAAPLECQPLSGESRFIPQFHAIPELRQRASDGLWWPGQANDANAVFEHDGPSSQSHPATVSPCAARTL